MKLINGFFIHVGSFMIVLLSKKIQKIIRIINYTKVLFKRYCFN